MQKVKVPRLYQQYFIDKSDERRSLFQIIKETFQVERGIYPGSFVHVTPSFYIPEMTYIDSDKRLSKFFTDHDLMEYIKEHKTYPQDSTISWFQRDYSDRLPIQENTFDILFSFYAGFISQQCKKYLKNDGILVCNNSHGDASIAYTDKDYSLIGVINRNGDDFRIINNDLDLYFKKKDGSPIDTAKVLKKMTGENFTKKGYAYIFRKTSAD